MKEKLLKLISEAEFNGVKYKSSFLYDKPYKYSKNEDLRYLFWLTELQHWLFNNYKIYIEVLRSGQDDNIFLCFYEDNFIDNKFDSITSALEEGVFNVLTKIKDSK